MDQPSVEDTIISSEIYIEENKSMRTGIYIASFLLCVNTVAMAGDDPSIKGELRTNIQQSMHEHIAHNTIGGRYVIYDAVDDDVKRLEFKELHKGIVKKGNFYVSCADFVSADGAKLDLDFLVIESDGRLQVIQGLVHVVGKVKRKYHLTSHAPLVE